uniref:Uncharacterized protein n=1 Tax=Amphimedon queenslandica TaxID=400682 RepID=A0A1X7URE6_AMPQE
TSKQKSPLQKYSMIVFLFWLYLEKGITLKSSLSCKMYAEFCITVQWLMIRGHCQI